MFSDRNSLSLPTLLLPILLLFVVSGCDDDDSLTGPVWDGEVTLPDGYQFPTQPWAPDAFFPLTAGNFWLYSGARSIGGVALYGDSYVDVLRDTTINGIDAVLVAEYTPGWINFDPVPVGLINDTLHRYSDISENWYPVLELMLHHVQPGDTLDSFFWEGFIFDATWVESIGGDFEIGSTTFPNCVVVVDSAWYAAYDEEDSDSYSVTRTTFCPGIGMIARTGIAESEELGISSVDVRLRSFTQGQE